MCVLFKVPVIHPSANANAISNKPAKKEKTYKTRVTQNRREGPGPWGKAISSNQISTKARISS
jgi:hypothetical protein